MSRTRVRPSHAFLLFHENSTLGWTVIRSISFVIGEKLFTEARVRRVNDCNGKHMGYQYLRLQELDLPSREKSAALTASEMLGYATRGWKGGGSRTKHMTELQRISRVGGKYDKPLEPEARGRLVQ